MSTMLNEMKQNTRYSNLELYRIIVMLLIVAHHSIVNSGVMELVASDPLSLKSTFAYLFGMWGKTGINCFVMITGYFMCTSHITLRKWLKLVLEIMFYNIVISTIFWVTSYAPFTWKGLYVALMPVKNMTNDFISAFVVFYLCIPFLNKLVHALSQKEHLLLIGLSLLIYTLPLFLPLVKIRLVYVTWFGIVFFIASYIQLYPASIPHSNSATYWRNITLCLIALAFTSSVVFVHCMPQHDVSYAFQLVTDSNAILAIAVAVSSFLWFKNIKMRYSRFINTVAASCFGVLLIHANSDTMRHWLWRDVANIPNLFGGGQFALKITFTILTIYVVCTIVDFIRIQCIEKPIFKMLDNNLANCKWW